MLTTAGGHPVVIDGGKAGIVIELNAQTGKPIWKLPVGVHNGHGNYGAAHRERQARLAHPPAQAVLSRARHLRRRRDPAGQQRLDHLRRRQRHAEPDVRTRDRLLDIDVGRHRGGVQGDRRDGRGQPGHREARMGRRLPSSPYGAATVTNNVVFTTTFHGDLYALNAASGAILRTIPLSAGANAPVAIDGDYVITGQRASCPRPSSR